MNSIGVYFRRFHSKEKDIMFYSPKVSALALTVWVPLVRVVLISLVYSPKERFLKEPLWGVPLVWMAFFTLTYFWFQNYSPPYDTNFSMSYSPKDSSRGPIGLNGFLHLDLFLISKFYPPYDTNFSMSYCVGVGGVWGVFTFPSFWLEKFRAFFIFLKCV